MQFCIKQIVSLRVRRLWLHYLNLSKAAIAQFTRLRLDHYRLPPYAYYLGHNDSPDMPRR